MLSLKVL